MLFATSGQARVFLWMMAAGAMIGAWYALTAAARRLLCAGVWLSLAADIAFGLGAAVLFCGMLYVANYGRFRLYEFAAASLGFALFAAGVFPPARRAVRAAIRAGSHILVTIRQIRWIKVIFR